MTVQARVFAILLTSLLFRMAPVSAQEPEADPVRDRLRQAEVLFRFAMLERGSVNFMRDAKILVDEAEAELRKGDYDTATRMALMKEVTGFRLDLEIEDELAESTFYGAFPLVRFVKGSYLSDPKLISRYEFLKRPGRSASSEGLDLMLSSLGTTQCDVIILSDLSDPADEDLEREYLVRLGRQPQFFVRTARQLAVNIQEDELRAIYPPEGDSPVPAALFGTRPLLFVWIRRIESVGDCYHYVVEGHLFPAAGAAATKVVTSNGYCIDRRNVLPIVIGLHFVLLIAAPFLYRELARRTAHSKRAPDWVNTFALGIVGFTWGRVIVLGLAPLLAKTEPDPASSIYTSFWWPALFGPVLVLGPATVMRFAETRFKALGSAFVMYNRWGPLFSVVALGSTAFLVQAALHYDGLSAAGMIVPLLLGAPLAAFVVGRSLDKADSMPLWAGAVSVIATFAYGLAWCSASVLWLWLSLIPIGAGAAAAFIPKEKWAKIFRPKGEAVAVDEEAAAASDEDVEKEKDPDAETLTKLASEPPFHETSGFAESRAALEPWFEGQFSVVGLHGPAGWGKSKTVAALLDLVKERAPDAKLLRSSCAEPADGSTQEPFKPFQEAIAGHFSVNLLAPQKDEIKHLDKALGGLFDSVVPFAPLLFPAAKAGTQPGSRQEMFLAIASMLKQLASESVVLVVIDDTHWMDPASRELLEFLIEELQETPDCGIGILIAGREATDVTDVTDKSERVQLVPITPMSREEMQIVLHKGLLLHNETAEDLLAAIGGENRNLFWLFQIVVHLAQQDVFVWRDGGFGLRENIEPLGHYLPDDYRQSLETLLNKHPTFLPALTCAACVGLEFHVDELARGVDLPRLQLLQILHQIESETGIVRDLLDKDDIFAFQSSFMLETLRKILSVRAEGPKSPVAPQIIREFHYRLGQANEGATEDSNSLVYAVATHYYAAGATHGARGMDYCMIAARAASNQFQHDTARRFLDMAAECADAAGLRNRDFERERLLLECRAAHVEGKGRVEMAERCLEYLEEYTGAPFRVYKAAAQACYDAGIDTRNQEHFQATVALAEEILERFDEPLQQADARHFWGIALPPTESTDRRLHLRFALALVEGEEDGGENLDALRLKSRIANSLAEQLSYGSDEDKVEAEKLFLLSIEIDSGEDTWSAEGLAYSHGGIGRLYFFAAEPDIEKARHHFEKDLEFSIKTDSKTGQTKMNSLLGACDLKLADRDDDDAHVESALHCYKQARRYSEGPFDLYFALAGILECLGRLNRLDESDEFGAELEELAKGSLERLSDEDRNENPVSAIPRFCVPNLESALKQSEKHDADWRRWLAALVIENRVD